MKEYTFEKEDGAIFIVSESCPCRTKQQGILLASHLHDLFKAGEVLEEVEVHYDNAWVRAELCLPDKHVTFSISLRVPHWSNNDELNTTLHDWIMRCTLAEFILLGSSRVKDEDA